MMTSNMKRLLCSTAAFVLVLVTISASGQDWLRSIPQQSANVTIFRGGEWHLLGRANVVFFDGQVVIVCDTAPVPPIPPIPFPPTPVPPGKLATVVIIEESAERTPKTAAMLVDERLLTWRETRRPAWHLVDKDVLDPTGKPPAKFKAYLALAKDKPLPVLVLDSDSDGSNGILYSGSLPVGADKLLEVLNGF